MNLVEKKADNAVKRDIGQKVVSVCYICGGHHTADGELCPTCAGIISASLKLLRVCKTAC